MTTANINCQPRNTGLPAESLLISNEAIFVVDNYGCVSYGNDQLFQLIGTNENDLLGKPYTHLFRQLAALCDNEQQALDDLQIALSQLKDQPSPGHLEGRPSSQYVQVDFFSLHARDGQWCWGGSIRFSDTRHDYSPQRTEAFLALTNRLRSSLVSIIGCSTVLTKDVTQWSVNELRDFVATIAENAEHSLRLLENVRDSGIIDQHDLELNCQPINLHRLIHHVLDRLANKSAELGIVVRIPDTLPLVDVDVIRICRAFHSLFNSIMSVAASNSINIVAHQVDFSVQLDINYQGKNVLSEMVPGHWDDLPGQFMHLADQSDGIDLELFLVQSILCAHGGLLWTDTLSDHETAIHIALPLNRHVGTRQTLESATHVRQKLEVQARVAGPTGKVLVVENEPRISRLLKGRLEQAGHTVTCTNEGRRALELVAIDMPDIILLSWHLHDICGLDLCTALRELTGVPVIVMAGNFEEEDLVRSLNAGADDYILKPIQIKEVLARVQARLRRSYLPTIADKSRSQAVFKMGDLEIDFVYRQVKLRGNHVDLTPIEYKLLYNLAANAGRILTHEQLMSKVWGPLFNQEHHFLWVNISRLRAKLEDNPSDPKYILTERGVGYSLSSQ